MYHSTIAGGMGNDTNDPNEGADRSTTNSHSDSNNRSQAWAENTTSTYESSPTDRASFAARLMNDGIIIKKVNRNGSTHLRQLRCIYVLLDSSAPMTMGTASPASSSRNSPVSSNSTTSSSLSISRKIQSWRPVPPNTPSSVMALVWRKPPSRRGRQLPKHSLEDPFFNSCRTVVPLSALSCIRLGKATDRAHKSLAPGSNILSLQINESANLPCLDIEATNSVERDNLAKAFAEFFNIPVLKTEVHSDRAPQSQTSAEVGPSRRSIGSGEGKPPAPPPRSGGWATADQQARWRMNRTSDPMTNPPRHPQHADGVPDGQSSGTYPPPLPPSTQTPAVSSFASASSAPNSESQGVALSVVLGGHDREATVDTASDVSTITGHGYDHELVEELHQALNEMRVELEESRAEAARAVKVAEQAIQSAERSNSVEWQHTVTHKAAEAAALAQKRSAEAMARQRIAEERLEQEKRNAAFWRKQAEIAEEEAGSLQTRAAAAEVQRATLEERLDSISRESAALQDFLRKRLSLSEGIQRDALEASLERNRVLEMELNQCHRQLEAIAGNTENGEEKAPAKKRLSFSRKPKPSFESKALPLANQTGSSSTTQLSANDKLIETDSTQVAHMHAEAAVIRQQLELLRRTMSDELNLIGGDSKHWGEQMKEALYFAYGETNQLRERLALERASRRLLQHEVQDLRGTIRVYCRPRSTSSPGKPSLLTIPSNETITLHREKIPDRSDESLGPLSFEFDKVFQPTDTQLEVYQEIEEVILGVLEGYNISIMTLGKPGSGKTYSLFGDISYVDDSVSFENNGIELLAIEQLFSVTKHRAERYKDTFYLSIVEVSGSNERVLDLMAGTKKGEQFGEIIVADYSKKSKRKNGEEEDMKSTKLEIRADVHGETVIQGLLSVQVNDFDDFCTIWKDCLSLRRERLLEQGVDPAKYESSCHTIATLKVKSVNLATGLGNAGKIQFVDLAGINLIPSASSSDNKSTVSLQELTISISGEKDSGWAFENRSIQKLGEVIVARSQYSRSVPYRNSTLTHLLSDSLEHDTKVILLVCVSSDIEDAQVTATTMRLASLARRVWTGKATKHVLESSPIK